MADQPGNSWPYIDQLAVGDRLDSFFAVRKVEMRHTRENKPFLILDLADRTGHIRAKLWEDADAHYRALTPGTVVKVRAIVEEYLGNTELKLHLIRPASDTDEFEADRFVARADHDPDTDWAPIREAVASMQHDGLKQLFETLFADEGFIQRFTLSPAGKQWHHAYLGGLLEHTASLVQLAQQLCEHYPQLNRDLLIAGAVLHDAGKLWELEAETTIDYTVRGRLEGHIVLGGEFLQRMMEEVGDELDEETRVQLKHLVLSHQGELANSSPVVPMTREAFVLYYLDEIDSKLNALDRILAKHDRAGSKEPFTEYVKLIERFIYRGGPATGRDDDAG
ncbi:MAG: 3'-5' exoribonuclease YhaM [Calditrichaeota bacterium]|nr:3'-5' exoribonuclease YhaM [Calditrichota bacterium]